MNIINIIFDKIAVIPTKPHAANKYTPNNFKLNTSISFIGMNAIYPDGIIVYINIFIKLLYIASGYVEKFTVIVIIYICSA